MRALVLGAETPAGRALAAALAEAGAQLALVASTGDAETAFAVQRLARRTGAALSQAIDATNEMAVRVMVRQVSKALGGLDAVVFCADLGDSTPAAVDIAMAYSNREFNRTGGGGAIVVASATATPTSEGLPDGIRLLAVDVPAAPNEAWGREVLAHLAGPSHT